MNFIKYCREILITKTNLHKQEEESICIMFACLNKPFKDKISEKISRFKFENVVSYMYEEDLSEQFTESLKFIELLDKQRNESFDSTFPEFSQLIKEIQCRI